MSSASRYALALFAATVLLSFVVAELSEGHPALDSGMIAGGERVPVSTPTTWSVGDERPAAVVVLVAEARSESGRDATCILNRNGEGRVMATTAGGTTFDALLDPAVSALSLSGPMGDIQAVITATSTERGVLRLEADPPGIRIVIPLRFCRSGR